ncbi:four-carbon acid sugar kinase family protein [Paenarthrobacter sp. NPDC089316]|uniref:four-carbon acid sugar kinase family protein n=1 Tax=unclassified Paenarthrobacter TaxID=2634190 RepID=UPI0034453DFE
MASILVQADDFSGAAEVGSCFVRYGLTTQLILETLNDDSAGGNVTAGIAAYAPVSDVVVADTHTRGLSASEAGKAVEAIFAGSLAANTDIWFKKIDSLWRGNIHAEIEVLNRLGHSVVVAGALPQLGRSVRHGKPYVNGLPLDRTDLWQAEASTPPSTIAGLVQPDSPESVQMLRLPEVRSAHFPAILAEALTDGDPTIVVVDGESAQDLEQVVRALWQLGFAHRGRRIVLAGTGGLADVLARRLASRSARNAQTATGTNVTTPEPQPDAVPVLAVVGSASAVATTQLAHLEMAGFGIIRLDPGNMSAHGSQLGPAKQILRSSNKLAVTLQEGGVDPHQSADIVRALASFAVDAVQGTNADLILTGGATAREVLDVLGLRSLMPLAAVQHGAVLSRASDGTLVGTKPGSFGDAHALTQLHHQMQLRRAHPSDITTTYSA